MASGAPDLRRSVRGGQLRPLWHSSWLSGVLGAEVDDDWDNS
jgi:hypothetical protein